MRRAAFTFVEVCIGAILFTILLTGAWSLTSFGGRSTQTTMFQAECGRHAGTALERLRRVLADARTILFPRRGSSSDECLVLQTPAGVVQMVYPVPSGESLILRRTDADDGWLLGDCRGSNVLFGRTLFAVADDGTLNVSIVMRRRDGVQATFHRQLLAPLTPGSSW